MRFLPLLLLLIAPVVLQPCLAQDADSSPVPAPSPAPDQGPSAPGSTPAPAPSAAPASPAPATVPERPISWPRLGLNILQDQKPIWLFPVSVARGRHLKLVLVVTGFTAALIATADAPTARYFQRTQSFDEFNKIFSGPNTAAATFALPIAFYGVGLLRRDSYGQHTFLFAGEAVLDSEILTTVMKDVDRRLKPSQIPLGGNFSDSWFRDRSGNIISGLGSFPSGHMIAAFSVATVFAERYPKPRWHSVLFYGLASLVGFSRLPLQAHFASDVFAGGAFAYAIAHYVVLRNP